MPFFKDKAKKYFGFETTKESLDRKINNYETATENKVKHSMAIRQQAISNFSEQIRQLEIIIKDNQYFIDSYEIIRGKAIEKVKQGYSLIYGKWIDKNGQELFQANYKTMSDYYSTLLKKGINAFDVEYYNKQLSVFLKKAWILYANCIISEKGILKINGQEVDSCYDIYSTYINLINSMNAGKLKNSHRSAIKLNETGMNLIIKAMNLSEKANSNLSILLSHLKNNLELIKNDQASDEYIIKVIEETRALMKSSEEYFKVKLSHDYLEEFGRK